MRKMKFLAIIAMFIGPIEIEITSGVKVSIMPLLYTIVLGLVFYLVKPIKLRCLFPCSG